MNRKSEAMGYRGAVSSAHPLATLAGIDVLRSGGSAVDATIATNAVLGVTQPDMCGIGGDLFTLVYEAKTGKVHFLNASGPWSKAHGREQVLGRYAKMPLRGPWTVTVPGTVSGWAKMHERFGKQSWGSLFNAAIAYAEAGFAVSRRVAKSTADVQSILARDPGASRVYLSQGRPPMASERLVQRDLADTMRRIGQDPRDFYEGQTAKQIAAFMQAVDGPLTYDDLKSYEAQWSLPLRFDYRGYTLYETGDNTQGFVALVALGLLAQLDLEGMAPDSDLYLHLLVEAKKLAFADRRDYLTDPAFSPLPFAELMAPSRLKEQAAKINSEKVLPTDTYGSVTGDTTAFSVVDAEGNMVSAIQSIFFAYGSGLVVPDTGICLQNRGAYFSLEEDHVNRLEAGKRTAHTLMAGMMFEGTTPVLSFSTMGADGQAQIHLQVLSRMLDFDQSLLEAIDAPRFVHGPIEPRSREVRLLMEDDFGVQAERLGQKGHLVEIKAYGESVFGHAQGIYRDPVTGAYVAVADPRGDGAALAW